MRVAVDILNCSNTYYALNIYYFPLEMDSENVDGTRVRLRTESVNTVMNMKISTKMKLKARSVYILRETGKV